MPVREVPIDDIRIDGGTQIRERIDEDTVAEYASRVQDGNDFPACIIFHDGSDQWLADGFHRVMGHKRAGKPSILCDVRKGTKRDAILYACGANSLHGLRRTNADKRRAVMTLLGDVEWVTWSNREIARRCGVDESTVRSLRDSRSETTYHTKHGTVATMKTAKIGRTEPLPALRTVDLSSDAQDERSIATVEDPFADPNPKRLKVLVVTCRYCGEVRPNDPGRCPLCGDTPRISTTISGTATQAAAAIAEKFDKTFIRDLVAELKTYLD